MESPFREPVPDGTRLIETFRFEPESGFHDLPRHLQRLERSAASFGYPFDREGIIAELAEFNADQPMRCRLTLGADGGRDFTSAPLGATAARWIVAIAGTRLQSDDAWLVHKTTQRAVYDRARADLPDEVDEWLFLNERDELCEGTITNVFVTLKNGERVTPPLGSGCLPGVLRQRLLEQGDVREQVVTLQDLQRAQSITVGNSLRGEIPAVLLAS